jgi:choline kinase
MHIIVPMAGDGSRFKGHGLGDYKPLIKIGDKTLVEKTIESLDKTKITSLSFGIREEHEKRFNVSKKLLEIWPNATIVRMGRTRGNLETCYNILRSIDVSPDSPVVFVDCDNPFTKINIFDNCFNDDCDVCLLGFVDQEKSNKWCYVTHSDNIVTGVYEKDIETAGEDAIALIGFFAFKKASYFTEIAEDILQKKTNVKGECYTSQSITEALSRGTRVNLLIADNFIPMGTAEDVKKIL